LAWEIGAASRVSSVGTETAGSVGADAPAVRKGAGGPGQGRL